MRLSFSGVLRSEWCRLWSLRAPAMTLGALLVAPVLLGLIRAAASARSEAPASLVIVEGIGLAAIPASLVAAAFGLLVGVTDLVDDAITSLYVVAPRRRWVAVAKLLTASSLVLATATIASALTLATSSAIVTAAGSASIDWAVVLPAAAATIAAQLLLSCIALSIALLTRSITAGAVWCALVLVVAPVVLGITGRERLHPITQLLPVPALQGSVHVDGAAAFPLQGTLPSTLDAPSSLLVLAGWALVAGGIAIAIAPRLSPTARPSGRGKGRARAHHMSPRSSRVAPSFSGLMKAEIARTSSTVSVRWLLGIAVLLIPATTVLAALGTSPDQQFSEPPSAEEIAGVTPTFLAEVVAAGITTAQVPLAILGALTITTEVATRSWETTLLAVPRPRRVVAARMLALVVLVVPAITVACALTALAAPTLVQTSGFVVDDVGAVLATTVARVALIAALVTTLGVAVGALIPRTLLAVAVLTGLLLLAPAVFGQLQQLTQGTPLVLLANVGQLLPSAVSAGSAPLPANAFMPLVREGGALQLAASASTVVLLAWTCVCAAAALIRRRRHTPEQGRARGGLMRRDAASRVPARLDP